MFDIGRRLHISAQRGFGIGKNPFRHIPTQGEQLLAGLQIPAGHLTAHLVAQVRPLLLDELIGVAQDLLLGVLQAFGLEILHLPVDLVPLLLRVLGDGLHKFADFLVAVRHNVTVPCVSRLSAVRS